MKRIALAVLVLALAVISLALPTFAQDDAMMDAHVCDSTTILLLYIAEYDYGFQSMMDAATFDKGQYAPLFEEMMAMMEEEEMGEEMMEEEMGEEMMMDESMTMLALPVIEGEDEACTALRAELDTFFYETLYGMMMDDMESDG
jgi:hypothetical protein